MPHVQIRTALAAATSLIATQALGAPPPAAAFGRLPAIQEAAISPDGQKLALLGAAGDHRVIVVAPIDGAQSKTVDLGKAEIGDLRWAGSSFLLVTSSVLDRGVYEATGVKYAYRMNRDFVLTQDGQVVTYLLKDSPVAQVATVMPILEVVGDAKPEAIVDGRDWSPSHFEVTDTLFKRSNEISSALWRVDVATGAGHVFERGQPDTKGWAVDLDGDARARIDYDDKGRAYHLLVRPKTATGWKTLLNVPDQGGAPRLLGYSTSEDALYLEVTGADGVSGVERHSLADGGTTAVGPAGSFDIRFDPYTQAPLEVISGKDAQSEQWLDPQLGPIAAKLSHALPARTIKLANWSKDRARIVVEASSADAPNTWYLLERAKGQLSLVGESRPDLTGVKFGETTQYIYRARDGLVIPAYLTLPPGGAAGGLKPPLIVLPHAGPNDHDDGGFDWMVQFLASRGYAVLRPQFRGSSGFGLAFERAGDHEWGGKMQTDLLDGMADLAAKGLADTHRTCIVGMEFGGYAALAGMTLHGDAYRCAVAINGISDLPLLYSDLTRQYSSDSDNVIHLKQTLGETASDVAATAAISPAQQAAHASGPILLIASAGGTVDAPFDQTTSMSNGLQNAGRPAQTLVIDGDDGLSSSAARIQALEAIEAFLAKALPVSP